ncbi:ABC transporter ATP-binding protein [Zavarzinella formosa]|uniref:ABC transporter ATP-binding protein n=1 Tax=Zavarzinella formosa TaxID=360055 RepID=UPI0002F6D072|nr:ABC transporter ATP-binding protein [Zavarzinella formosa]
MSENPKDFLLYADQLHKQYPDGQVRALGGVSLGIKEAEYTAITGPSGCGKSTLLNVIGALDRPDKGEVFFRGAPLGNQRDLDRFRARQIGFVFQSFFLLPTLTSLENVQIPMFEGALGSRERTRKAEELLGLVGMSHRAGHRPGQLSVGERQRIALARSLANDPVLLLADEPTGNLDSHNATLVLDLLTNLRRDRRLSLLIVTHSPDVAARADRVIRMRDGQIVAN